VPELHQNSWPSVRIAAIAIPGLGLALLGPAQAAGFGVYEFNAEAIGSAYATATATRSPDYVFYNPAAIGGLEDFAASAAFTAILPNSDADVTGASTVFASPIGGDAAFSGAVGEAFVPALAIAAPIADKLTAGLSVYAPWGLQTEYPRDWAGRYYAVHTELLTLNINPVLAYDVTDRLTVAAGLQAQYADGRLSNAVDFGSVGAFFAVPGASPAAQDGFANFEADDWSFGYNAGLMAEIVDGLTFGFHYRSKVEQRLEGELEFTLDEAGVGAALSAATGAFVSGAAATDIAMPAQYGAGLRFDAPNGLSFAANAWRTQWSSFQELRVEFANPAQADDVTVNTWKDAWAYSVGLEYAANARLTGRLGAMRDQSPTRDATRSPRIPDNDRTWVAAGLSYAVSPQAVLSASGAHMFVKDADFNLSAATPENAFRGNLAGVSEAAANVISLQITFKR